MSHTLGFLLGIAFVLVIIALAFAQDVVIDETKREARVSTTRYVKSATRGGHQIVLAFEDDLEPETFILIVDERFYDNTFTGQLFYLYFDDEGKMTRFTGPIDENSDSD